MGVDSADNFYVPDSCTIGTIRKVTAAGVVTTLAARFYNPTAAAGDSTGNVYVADNKAILKVTVGGAVTTLAGTAGMSGSVDGTGATARFNNPAGIAIDSAGNLYVADSGNSTIRKVTAAGVVTTLAGTAGMGGSADGTGAAARFGALAGLSVDSAGNVYVADQSNNTIRRVTATGVVTTLAGTAGMFGSVDGTGAAARFHSPGSAAVDSAGNVYVADDTNETIRKVTAAGVVTTLAGTAGMNGNADGTGAAARFFSPRCAAVDSAGNVYVADNVNSAIRKVTATGVVTTLAGAAEIFDSVDGTGAAARFDRPAGVAVDSTGNVYVAESPTIRKVTAAGVVTTLAGTAGMGGSADGTGAAARFGALAGLSVDSAGNVYVADKSNNTIRRVTTTGVVTTLAGTAGMPGSADGTGAAARFNNPTGVAVDSTGNVYVADSGNFAIRKVTVGGVVTTLAGTVGMAVTSVAVDTAGNVYGADQGSSTIRKVTAAGVVTTLADTSGFHNIGVAVDNAGNIYVADSFNSTIRKITPAGITTTIAGTAGVIGIILGATPRFSLLEGLAVNGDSIVISDTNAILLLRHGAQ